MAYDIFLSYRRTDQPIARAVVEELEKRGLSVWWDQRIDGGEDWRDAIVAGLEQSNALVILFSAECNASKQLRKELAIADTLDKVVVPVLIEDTKPKGHFLYELAARNWIQIFPHAEKRAGDLAEKLADDLRGQNAQAESFAPSGGLDNLTTHERAEVVQAKVDTKRAKERAKKQMRDFLPFRWIDIPLILALNFAVTVYLDPEFDSDTVYEFAASFGLWSVFLIAGFGALIFPIRYYMRKRRFWRAVGSYLLSSAFLYALSFGVFLYASEVVGLTSFGEAGSFLLITGVMWAVFFVVAFILYAILSGQRAVRNFRRNVEVV